MTPYRSSRTGNRSVRDQHQDVFSGLPVRRWRKYKVTISPTPPKEESSQPNSETSGWPELPMPHDTPFLTPYNQELLRAARSPRGFRRPAPPVAEDKEAAEHVDAEGDIEPGYVATKWGVVPRHLEGSEPEFLAKRRKGLPSLYGAVPGTASTSSQMRKTKIRKTDSEGHEHVLEALVPEGQTVEGEVTAEEKTASEAPAPGTVVEGVGIVNAEGVVIAENQVQPTPPRRKPPPPKRKAKGPGRGRKKRVAFTTSSGGALPSQDFAKEHVGQAKTDGDAVPGDGDVGMGDDSVIQDADEGSEDDEEGEDGEEGDREDGELSPSPVPMLASSSKEFTEPEPKMEEMPMQPEPSAPTIQLERGSSSSPDLPLAANQSLRLPDIQIEPAKNVESSEAAPVLGSQGADPLKPASKADHLQAMDQAPQDAPPQDLEPVSVENPPQLTDPEVKAAIPAEHNPLEGLVEPKGINTQSTDSLHFLDGEEDLLGSLERHLGKQG